MTEEDLRERPVLRVQQPFRAEEAIATEISAGSPIKKVKITDFFYKNLGSSLGNVDILANPTKPSKTPGFSPVRQSTQLYLDFGQKNLAATSCAECGMTYDPAFLEDVKRHDKEHERLHAIFQVSSYEKICSWKELSRSGHLLLLIRKSSSHQVEQLCHRVNQLMGAAEQSAAEIQKLDIYLRCCNGRIIGFLSLEKASSGLLVSDYTGIRHSVNVLVGVSRIWTAPDMRRQGIGMLLLRNIRHCTHTHAIQCIDACLIPSIKVAFSQPTAAGKELASRYLGLGAESCIYVTYASPKAELRR